MFAIIETGGKQYTAVPSKKIQIEKLPKAKGDKVTFDKVLLVADGNKLQVGKPYLSGASVTGTLVAQGRGEKIEGLKYRAKSRYRRSYGHRQAFAEVKIESIDAK